MSIGEVGSLLLLAAENSHCEAEIAPLAAFASARGVVEKLLLSRKKLNRINSIAYI